MNGDETEADRFAREFADEDVSSALGFRNRGAAKHGLERYEEAIADYTKSIELEPASPDTFVCRARSFLKTGKINEALDDAAHSYEMTKDADAPENYIWLAIIFEECKRSNFVIDCIRKYLNHAKELNFYYDGVGDLWAVKNGYKSTSFSTTGNIVQIDYLCDAEEILKRIQKQFESDDKQQKLFPFSTIDELRKDLSITKKRLCDSIKKLKEQNND
jgi:tetratricopeptide (TPR) repeat protein